MRALIFAEIGKIRGRIITNFYHLPYHCCVDRRSDSIHSGGWTDKILCRFFGAPTVLRR